MGLKILLFQSYRDPNFRLATKVKACEGVGQEWSLGVTFHVPRNVGECEGMNPHTPKWVPLWELESQWTFKLLERNYKGKTHWIEEFLITLENSWKEDV
jgi:hypothetical protein